MKIKALLFLVICAAVVAVGFSACKRRNQLYADIEGPKATATVDPNALYSGRSLHALS
jgi:uncharacterized membrane-anchored protein